MSNWSNWLVIAGIVVVLELFSGTFYLLMISIGLFAGALAAFLGFGVEMQLICAAIVGSIATILLRKSRFGKRNTPNVQSDPNVNLDIGMSLQVNDWKNISPELYTARAMHRGALWDVEYASPVVPLPGMFKIVEIRGSQLIVRPE